MSDVTGTASPASAPRAAADGPAMIEVENLTKDFGLTRAVDNISFSVAKGEILGFLGPNGAGKTTTMRILTCYTPATSGRARIGGFDTVRQSEDVRRIIGYLPESAPLYLDMTVRSYLAFMAEVKRYPASRRRALIDQAIGFCGLEPVANRLIRNLSKGFRQRTGLAQALMGNPQVLILDEPTVGLDPKQIAEIRELIKSLANQRTVILSTHILPEVSMTCQKVLIINNGKIEAQGTPQSLVSTFEGINMIMATIQGSTSKAQELLGKVSGVANVTLDRMQGADTAVFRIEARLGKDPRTEIAQAVVSHGLQLLELQSSGVTLEDIFLRVISRQREAA